MGKVQIDPIKASVIQKRLNAVTHDMAQVLQLTSRSPVFNEAGDFVTGIFDNEARMLEQSANIPIIGFGAQPALPSIIKKFEGRIYEGDVIVHNDVFDGGNQTHDVGIYKPVFYDEKLVGWVVSKGHLADLGGAIQGGYNPQHTEVWQEAIRIPGLKVIEKGNVITDVWEMLFANTRIPVVEEDVKAMIGACNIGERGFIKVIEKYGLESFEEHVNYLIEATEKQTREIIKTWKNGEYHGESYMIGDGFDPHKKYKVKVKIIIEDDSITMDFEGTAKQAPGFTNMPPASAKAACSIAYLMMINPGNEIAENDGLFKAFDCKFPKGSILNPNFPAATLFGNQMADVLLEAIMKALEKAVPERVTASWSKACQAVFNGIDPRDNSPYFDFGFLGKGGQGALQGYDGFDGIGFSGAAGSMISQDPENFEIKMPVFVEAYEYLKDSAGAGEYRGGLGTYLKLQINGEENSIGTIGDGMAIEDAEVPNGIAGGKEGTLNVANIHYPNNEVRKLGSKDMVFDVPKGSWYEQYSGGGGGYGDPLKRDIRKVVDEVIDGYMSIEKAREEYLVVMNPEDLTYDEEATLELRKKVTI